MMNSEEIRDWHGRNGWADIDFPVIKTFFYQQKILPKYTFFAIISCTFHEGNEKKQTSERIL